MYNPTWQEKEAERRKEKAEIAAKKKEADKNKNIFNHVHDIYLENKRRFNLLFLGIASVITAIWILVMTIVMVSSSASGLKIFVVSFCIYLGVQVFVNLIVFGIIAVAEAGGN